MHDATTIDTAYQEVVTTLFKTFFNSMAIAAGDAGKETDAEARFRAGIALARLTRDKAKAIVDS